MSDYSQIRTIQNALAEQLGELSRAGTGFYNFAHCPFCNKKRKGGIKPGAGFKCYSCAREVSTLAEWENLAALAGTPISDNPKPLPSQKQADAKHWQKDPMRYQSAYTSRLDVVAQWQAYKPISHDNIMRYQLGVGRLPPIGIDRAGNKKYSMGCGHERLTYANIENGMRQATGFRGRQVACTCYSDKPGDLKWITVAGTRAWLWNSDNLREAQGRYIIAAENPIDGILCSQAYPDCYPLAGTAGAGTWRPEWTQMIHAARPKGVLIWYDNDLIGNPTEQTLETMIAEWIAKQASGGHIPSESQIAHERTKAMAPKIAESLRALGTPARAYEWAEGTRPKMDAGAYLIESGVV